MEHVPYFFEILALLVGACMGSFVSAASHRLPLRMDIVRKPSHCPACETTLGIKDLVPLLSWCALKGKCRYCGTRISPRYPLIELACAGLFLLVYLHFGLTAEGLIMSLFVTCLMILIVTDLEYQIIPDAMQIALIVLAIPYHLLREDNWENALAGAGAGLLLGLTLRYGYLHLRKLDALGMGDVKFLFVAGLWLGFGPLVLMLILAGATGTIQGILWKCARRGPRFPFGPALATALFICVIWRDILSTLPLLAPFYSIFAS